MPHPHPATIFYGPNRRFEDLTIWPPFTRVLLTIHDLQPGQFWNPVYDGILHRTHPLSPNMPPGFWVRIIPFFFLEYRQTLEFTRIQVFHTMTAKLVFRLYIPFAVHTWGHNSLIDPLDNVAYDGSITLSWQDF